MEIGLFKLIQVYDLYRIKKLLFHITVSTIQHHRLTFPLVLALLSPKGDFATVGYVVHADCAHKQTQQSNCISFTIEIQAD